MTFKLAQLFIRYMGPTTFANVTGMATQFATAPILLRLAGVDILAEYIMAVAISTYISLILNGYFYSFMNRITSCAHVGDLSGAQYFYRYSMTIVFYIAIFISSIYFVLIITESSKTYVHIAEACIISVLNFSYVMFDANFRANNQFAKGTNFISISKIADWISTITTVWYFQNIHAALISVIILKIASITIFIKILNRSYPALSYRAIQTNLKTAVETLKLANSQINIAMTTAAITMLPQIFVSSIFPASTAVAFNITRTYFRLITVAVNSINAASWPHLNKWHATKNHESIVQYCRIGSLYNLGASSVMTIALYVMAPYLLPIIASKHLVLNCREMLYISGAVFFTANTMFYLSFYVSTGERSRLLYALPAMLFIQMLCLLYFRESLSYTYYLIIFALFDMLMAVVAATALFHSISQLKSDIET